VPLSETALPANPNAKYPTGVAQIPHVPAVTDVFATVSRTKTFPVYPASTAVFTLTNGCVDVSTTSIDRFANSAVVCALSVHIHGV
jgi:hypothetical protein